MLTDRGILQHRTAIYVDTIFDITGKDEKMTQKEKLKPKAQYAALVVSYLAEISKKKENEYIWLDTNHCFCKSQLTIPGVIKIDHFCILADTFFSYVKKLMKHTIKKLVEKRTFYKPNFL